MMTGELMSLAACRMALMVEVEVQLKARLGEYDQLYTFSGILNLVRPRHYLYNMSTTS